MVRLENFKTLFFLRVVAFGVVTQSRETKVYEIMEDSSHEEVENNSYNSRSNCRSADRCCMVRIMR